MTGQARLVLITITLLMVGAAILLARQAPTPELGIDQVLFSPAKTVNAFDNLALRRADTNQPIERRFFSGRWSLLYTGYLNCPDICPTTLAVLAQLQAGLSSRERQQLQIVFVSIDPHRDTPEEVRRYTAAFSPNIVPVTGNTPQLNRLTDALGLIDPPQTEVDNVGHSSAIALIGPQTKLRGMFRYPQQLNMLETTLRTLI